MEKTISLEMFNEIATYCNDAWRGFFTETEVKENADNYYSDYLSSISNNKVSDNMYELCYQMVEDMDFMDYQDVKNTLSAADMNNVILDFYKNMVISY